MAKTIDQDIPSEMADAYDTSLHRAAIWIPGSSIRMVRKRVPFRMGHMQNSSTQSPSGAQRLVRAAFKKSCNCFNIQPYSGGATPPAGGPRNRSWWYDQAAGSGLWYYDYFIQQTWPGFYANTTPAWCMIGSLTPFAYNRVRADRPGESSSTSVPRSIYNAEGLPHMEAFYQYDFTQANLESIIPGYFPGMITGATLHCWMFNDMIFDMDSMTFKNQAGKAYAGQVDYWDPATATWNNKPTTPPQILERWSYVYEGPEGPTNELFTEHNLNISAQVLAAIAAGSPYLTVAHKVAPHLTGDYEGFDPTWRLGLTPAEYHPIILLE